MLVIPRGGKSMSRPKVALVKAEGIKGNAEFMGGRFVRYDQDVAAIRAAVKKSVELTIGSLDSIIQPGDRVLIKPNLAFQAPAESFAVVDPRTVEAVVAYIKEESKAGEVWVGDNPSLGLHVGRAKPAFVAAGMEEAAYRGGADKVIYFDEAATVVVDIPLAKVFKRAEVFLPFLEADVVINLPKLKVHLAGTVTLGLKNWNGIIPNRHPDEQQQGAHRIDLGQKFADLYRVRKADLTIIDGIIGMEGQGPHAGTPVEMNLIVTGADTVAVDAVASYTMGFDPVEIPAVRIAANEGLGVADLDAIEVVGENKDAVRRVFKRPNDNPVGMYRGLTVIVQQTCPGCYVNIRGALDSFKNTGIDMAEFVDRKGECIFVAGGVPDFDPALAQDKNLFVCGNCWKYFPSSDKVEEAMSRAKRCYLYPGCAPVYIFSQINKDLQTLAQD